MLFLQPVNAAVVMHLVMFVCLCVCSVHAVAFESVDPGTSSEYLGQIIYQGHWLKVTGAQTGYTVISRYVHMWVLRLRLQGKLLFKMLTTFLWYIFTRR